jgi:hypothetical protein
VCLILHTLLQVILFCLHSWRLQCCHYFNSGI